MLLIAIHLHHLVCPVIRYQVYYIHLDHGVMVSALTAAQLTA